MSDIPHLKMLGLVRRHLDEAKLISENPEISTDDVDAFFRKLTRDLSVENPSGKSAPDSGTSARRNPATTEQKIPAAKSASTGNASTGNASKVIVYSDGASKGNPGDAGAGFVVMDEVGGVLCEDSRYLGQSTNNIAEYQGAIMGLEAALKLGARAVLLRADSELMVKQLNGVYRVKNPGIKPLYDRLVELTGHFDVFKAQHIPREKNARADKLASSAATRK